MFECKSCLYVTNRKSNYDDHLKTKKHGKSSLTVVQNVVQISPKSSYSCKYCSQMFNHRSSIYKHIRYSCTKNKDEDMKELVRLMNMQIENQNKQIERQQKQIDKLMGKLEINGSFNTTINNNITLLAYKESDTSHLTEKDYMNCIKQVNFCVKQLIEKIHFNPAKPENMNIYISNLKDKYMMVYEAGAWNIKSKDVIESIYNDKELMLEEWLEEQHKHPELKEKFVRYINNKENDDTLNMIKEEIKLMMYNKTKQITA